MKEKEKNGERRRMSPPKIYSRSATAYTSLISKQTNKSFLNNPFLYHVYYNKRNSNTILHIIQAQKRGLNMNVKK